MEHRNTFRIEPALARGILPIFLLAGCSGSDGKDDQTGVVQQKVVTAIPGVNVNTSPLIGNQTEEAIAIDPTNPNRLFVGANSEAGGIFAAFSDDAGQTWNSSSSVGDANPGDSHIGNSDDLLDPACCDPTTTFDAFGNLYYGYLGSSRTSDIAISVDGGATFADLVQLGNSTDQPTIVTGPDQGGVGTTLWIYYDEGGDVVQGAVVTGLGAAQVGAFSTPVLAGVGQFGDIAIGPNGQVMVVGQVGGSTSGNTISVALDPDGLGPQGFSAAGSFTSDVGLLDTLSVQPTSGTPLSAFGVDAEPALAYDRSGGPFQGRVYIVYNIEVPDESDDTDVVLRYSDDDGANWSDEIRVHDDTTTNAQWLPRIAVDQTTGIVAVSFHDARNDDGAFGAGDTDGVANTNSQLFIAFSDDGGDTFTNTQVSAGTSDSVGGDPPAPGLRDIDYGDYSGLAFHNGAAYPAWADNSNSTGDNPEGTLDRFDVYTARVVAISNAVCVLGEGTLDIRDNTNVLADAGAGNYLEIGASAILNGSGVVGGDAFIRSNGTVEGDLTLAGTLSFQEPYTINGTLTENGAPSIPSLQTKTFPFGSGFQEITGTVALTPGNYGDVVIRPGASVSLSAGVYNFASLNIETNVTVLLGGQVELNVEGNFAFGDRSQVLGGSTLSVYSNGGNVRIGTDVLFAGVLVAPNANITVYSRTTINGCIGGENVVLDANMTLDSSGLILPTGGTIPVPPSTCSDGVQNGNETGVDCGGPDCSPCPTGSLSATLNTQSDWGAGYCMNLSVTNTSTLPTTTWLVTLDLDGSVITGSWNGAFSGSSGVVTVGPGFSWNEVILPSQTNTSVGFCAARPPGAGTATVTGASGTF